VVPRVMGFDARLQFLHPSDAVDALVMVTAQDLPGTFNVAADDMVTLSQALRMMGRPTVGVPQPLAPIVATMGRQARLLDFSSDQINALTYGRGMDTSRFRTATDFAPAYTSKQALTEFVAATPPGVLSRDRVDTLLDHLSRAVSASASDTGRA
jgi:UDP-glucose 4-epimerase